MAGFKIFERRLFLLRVYSFFSALSYQNAELDNLRHCTCNCLYAKIQDFYAAPAQNCEDDGDPQNNAGLLQRLFQMSRSFVGDIHEGKGEVVH